MRNLYLLIVCAFVFNGCAIKKVYEKEKSMQNANKKINYIIKAIKEKKPEKKSTYESENIEAYTKSSSEVCVNGNFYHDYNINNNMTGDSYQDLEKLVKDNFLILRRQYYRTGLLNTTTSWRTSYIIGDGTVRLDFDINGTDYWYRTQKCPSNEHIAYFREYIRLFSFKKVNESSALNRDISKVNEKAFIILSKGIDKSMERGERAYKEAIDEANYNREKRNAYIEKKNQEREKRDAEHFITLQKKVNNNMKFFSQNNAKYIKQQYEINGNKNNNKFKSNTYESNKVNKTPDDKKINTIHKTYYQEAILTAKINQEKNGINYYSNKAKYKLPNSTFNACNEEFTSVYDLETKYRKECVLRFGSTSEIAQQCAIQGGAKANDIFFEKYKNWFGRICSAPLVEKSPGKHDYEK